MIRSAFLALSTALILVVVLGWQNIMASGWGQLNLSWDTLTSYYNQEKVTFPGVITDEDQIDRLVPKMVEANVSLANAPYPRTQTEAARLTTPNRECESPKANLDKTSLFLRSTLFEPMNPIVAYHDRTAKLAPELALFFQDYGYGSHGLTTNASGERTTVPLIEQSRKTVVAGGSVAFGASLDDANTLASRLQAVDGDRQYINLGTPEDSPEFVICTLATAIARYRGQVDELIYIYSEAALDHAQKYGTPEEVVARLKTLVQSESITKVMVIYAPTIYNVAPQLTRSKGNASERFPNRDGEKDRLRKIVAGAEFGWLDFGEIAIEASKSDAAPFAVLDNFADDRDLSLLGMTRLAEKIKPPKPEVPPVAAAAEPGEPQQQQAQQPQEQQQHPLSASLEKRIEKQSAALEQIRAAAGRAAKNNRLKREVGEILDKLKQELASDSKSQP